MAKMWAGRTAGDTSKIADEFNSSIGFDSRMFREDITGSIAHAKMLSKQRIISSAEADTLCDALAQILEDIENKKLAIDMSAEDIHMFVEEVLTARVGDLTGVSGGASRPHFSHFSQSFKYAAWVGRNQRPPTHRK